MIFVISYSLFSAQSTFPAFPPDDSLDVDRTVFVATKYLLEDVFGDTEQLVLRNPRREDGQAEGLTHLIHAGHRFGHARLRLGFVLLGSEFRREVYVPRQAFVSAQQHALERMSVLAKHRCRRQVVFILAERLLEIEGGIEEAKIPRSGGGRSVEIELLEAELLLCCQLEGKASRNLS